MNIQNDYNNISMYGKSNWWRRAKQAAFDKLPEKTFKDDKLDKYAKIGNTISRPAENRGIMGLTALILQPLIDFCNDRVDDATRTVSVCRTIAKIIAGTCVGMVVRGSCFKLVEKMTEPDGKGKYSKSLLPEKYIHKLAKKLEYLKNYRNALSTGIAILAMCITNFAIDAPLTAYLTNKFTEKAVTKQQEKKEAYYG